MANCPKCGSEHIQLKTGRDVNWGRVVVGWALFGAVGGAVGAVTGEDKSALVCLDCGTSWVIADLYNLRQFIKPYINGGELDLKRENHRLFMNGFVTTIPPMLQELENLKKESQKRIAEKEANRGMGVVFFALCVVFGAFYVAYLLNSIGAAVLGVLLFFIVIFLLVWFLWRTEVERESQFNKEIEDSKLMEERAIKKAKIKITLKVQDLKEQYNIP